MTTLDKVTQMQQQGLSNAEISTQLQNEGISPTEINDSLNQAQIKSAVSPPEQMAATESTQEPAAPIQQMPQETPQTQTFESQPQYQESYAPQSQQPQDDYYQQTPQAYNQQKRNHIRKNTHIIPDIQNISNRHSHNLS